MEANVLGSSLNFKAFQVIEMKLKNKLIIIFLGKMPFNKVHLWLEKDTLEKLKHTLKFGIEK